MRRALLAAAALLLAAVPVLAKPPGPEMHWTSSWKEALEEAKVRNVPIHVAFHKDH